ncbi:MAG: fumarate reductase iron-sulfur subunit [Peptococcaceae bacterium]|nr:fumarate reductase iron-sulfur subunit [Peptococcaceae bacterium]
MNKKIKQRRFSIFRYNPQTPEVKPFMQEYFLDDLAGMTIFVALNNIRETQDPSLNFDFVCRAAICGSCAMLINGKPRLACKTLTSDLKGDIVLMPLPVFKLLGDLSVDTGSWFREITIKTQAWIHTESTFNPELTELPMENSLANEIYEAERCIECGCCIAGCVTANLRENFLGAAGVNKVARFIIDPRDRRETRDYFEIIGSDDGTFGCMSLMACEDNCPMELPLQKQLSFVRRKMLFHGLGKS